MQSLVYVFCKTIASTKETVRGEKSRKQNLATKAVLDNKLSHVTELLTSYARLKWHKTKEPLLFQCYEFLIKYCYIGFVLLFNWTLIISGSPFFLYASKVLCA